jgi:2-polyprenyl-3-methyl-5-hydroxy-6-metoxy-1,4-benzoquinol methylase
MTISEQLDTIARRSLYAKGNNVVTIAWSYRIFANHLRPGNVLELGPAEGIGTEILCEVFDQIHCVDGSQHFCNELSRRFPRVVVHCALFEEFEPDQTYDNIILGHVLEHVSDPVAVLTRCQAWMRPNGRLFAAVPNARSLHRQAAVLMDLMPDEAALSAKDVAHGHHRVYDPETFRSDLRSAGLEILRFGGYWLKPLSDGQLERDWTREMLLAFMELGERYPDVAAELYAICEVRTHVNDE